MKFIKQLLVSALLVGASFGAHAADYDLGNLSAGTTEFGEYSVTGSFLDKIAFTLDSDSIGSFGAGPLNFKVAGKDVRHISNLNMSLFNSSNVNLGGGLEFSLSPLAAGNYYLQISGLADGTKGGYYAGAIEISPVPEPGTWTTLLAGLAMFGFMAYRRREV